MKAKRIAGITILAMAALTGCAGLATFQPVSENQQQALFQNLQTNPADYRVHRCPGLILVEPESSDKSIELIGEGCRLSDPSTEPPALDTHRSTQFRALQGKNSDLFAYIQWNSRAYRVGAKEIDGDTLRVWCSKVEFGGP
ncbi:MAG: hypothetical protein LJE94_08045 [Deltaproteobacteria bacterium]|nr:hypothetical protein [Deltaproteobacteria bacterium]